MIDNGTETIPELEGSSRGNLILSFRTTKEENILIMTGTTAEFLTHQAHDVPRVPTPEGLAVGEGDGDHGEDDDGAEEDPQVVLHRCFHHAGEGEHTHHAEGEDQLQSQDAEHLRIQRSFIHKSAAVKAR